MSALIAFYSRSENNYVNGQIKCLKEGNTGIMAEMIRNKMQCDLFRLEPCVSYAKDYSECLEEARQDQKRDARPELRCYPVNMDQYDTIYLGYPNYWGTMPMAIFTFLERYDFTGKTIFPFYTCEWSGAGKSVADIRRICNAAQIGKPLVVTGAMVNEAGPLVTVWLNEQKYK